MAMYHLSTKPIKRSDGRSATASAAYRAAEKIYDKRTGLTHDYSKKLGVVDSCCFVLKDNKMSFVNRSELWNAAESAEKRKDGRTAREIVISLPHEMTDLQRSKLVTAFTIDIAKKYGVAIDYAIHRPDADGDNRNHHCHIMMTTRTATIENYEIVLGNKTNLELSNTKLAELDQPKTQDQIKDLRQHWATLANEHLADANIDATIDHRSHADRNMTAAPTIKMGWEATAAERDGIETIKGDINRNIKADNAELAKLESKIAVYQKILDATAPTPEPEHIEYAPAPALKPRPKVEPEPIEYKSLRLANDSDTSRYYALMHMHDDAVKTPQNEYFGRFVGEKMTKIDFEIEQFRQGLSRNMGAATSQQQEDMQSAFSEVKKWRSNIEDYQDAYRQDKAQARAELEDTPDIVTQPHNATAAPQPDPEPYSTPFDRTPFDPPSTPWDR